MINISRLATGLIRTIQPQLLLHARAGIHHDGDELPRQYNFYYPKPIRKILVGRQIRPKIEKKFHDVLELPSQDEGIIADLFNELVEREVPISPEHACMMIHQFIENGLMTKDAFDKLESHAYRHKGQYQLRSLFGGIRGAVLYNRRKLVNFFLEEYHAHAEKFTVVEMLELAEAVIKNRWWSLQEKQEFWNKNLKEDFADAISVINQGSIKLLVRAADMLNSLEEYDEKVWEGLILAMDNKKGWGRISILEKLYPLSGTFESAKTLFDKYFEEVLLF